VNNERVKLLQGAKYVLQNPTSDTVLSLQQKLNTCGMELGQVGLAGISEDGIVGQEV